MNTCLKCGYVFEGNICPACGKKIIVQKSAETEKSSSLNLNSMMKGDWKRIFGTMEKASMRICSDVGSGTGFFLLYKNKKVIITNNHVVEGGTFFTSEFSEALDDRKEKYPMRLIAIDPQNDLAALQLMGDIGDMNILPGRCYLEIADLKSIGQGDDVCTLGNPKYLKFILTRGHVSGIGEGDYSVPGSNYGSNRILVNITATNGNSGGAVCDAYGKVIGIVTAGTDILPEQIFCVTSFAIETFVSALANKGLLD